MSKKTMSKKNVVKKHEPKNWYDGFVNYAIEKWREKGTVTDEASTRESIDAMMFLLSNYRLKCLMATLAEVDDLIGEFDTEHPEYSENEENEEVLVEDKKTDTSKPTTSKSEKSNTKDIYSGNWIELWKDDSFYHLTFYAHSLSLMIPKSEWKKQLKELRELCDSKQSEVETILDKFGSAGIPSENIFHPTFQCQKDSKKLIKLLDSKKYTKDDEVKCREYFEKSGYEILIIWDTELENPEPMMKRIKDFSDEEIPNIAGFIGTA